MGDGRRGSVRRERVEEGEKRDGTGKCITGETAD